MESTNTEIKVIAITACAEGYHSGSSYKEQHFITPEAYEKVRESIKSLGIYIYGLDGKHSQVEAEIDIDEWTIEDIRRCYNNDSNSGESLYNDLASILKDNELDIEAESDKCSKIISSVDKIVTVNYRVPESKVAELNKFVEELNNNKVGV